MYTQPFDFIHGRMLFTCFRDPRAVFRRAYEALSPGGYFEMQDIVFDTLSIDGTHLDTNSRKWNDLILEGARKMGRDWHCTRKYAEWFRDVGFENVVERRFMWPVNSWPKGKKQKTMGMWMAHNALEGLPAISMAIMTRVLGMSKEECEMVMVGVRKDIKNKSIHSYQPM